MDKQPEDVRLRSGLNILLWIGILVFFVYSLRTVMDLAVITQPRRLEQFMRILAALSKPNVFDVETSRRIAMKMWETIQIAFLATTISAVVAFPFAGVLVLPKSSWSRGFNIVLQPILAAVRSVHPLILTFPAAVLAGIGPSAGVLTLTVFSIAVLIVSFSEYARYHKSLSWPILIRIIFPALAFRHLYVNLLIASVIGFVGGGGIGFLIRQDMNLLNYRDVGASILALIIVIGSVDLLSRAVWYKIQNTVTSPSSTPEPAIIR